jgi:hypothetical protein
MNVVLPGQSISIDTPTGVEPTWYQRLKQIATTVNSGAIGAGTLPTTATTGFGFLPTCAGAPTGVPVPPLGTPAGITLAQCGSVPCVFDTTNNKLWIYNGAWKGVVLA